MVLPVYFTILLFFHNPNRKKRGICNILYEIVGVCIDSVTELTGFTLTSMTSSPIFTISFQGITISTSFPKIPSIRVCLEIITEQIFPVFISISISPIFPILFPSEIFITSFICNAEIRITIFILSLI
ncbi:hypothetical protein BMB171_C3566 [Bacillus thuringiensis BMB171]|nr:hypothetical protein BMB171_C3566 [Bacillus thuringiensis BMB171]